MTRKVVRKVEVNRAPVLTLWGAVVAERLGHDRAAALSLGRALAGFSAQWKGRRLGIFEEQEVDEERAQARRKARVTFVELMGRSIPTLRTREGVRAAPEGKVIEPEAVETYLVKKFGESLASVRREMQILARSYPAPELAGKAFSLYEKFRPAVPRGEEGWGAKGTLNLAALAKLAKPR